MFFKSL